jgi:predicted AlkP superfamily phosphohydrolase/phosphomutase
MLIGLDGATFDYIDPLVSRGRLPVLGGLMDRGARAIARSVSPPMTPAAWPSIYTGCRPDKHGVHGWFEGPYKGAALTPVSASTIRTRPIWEYLNAAGRSVGVMNVPLTYPAPEVDGFAISGFDSPFENPSWSNRMSYPPDLWDELVKITGSYKLIELLNEDAGDPELDPHFWARRPPPEVDWTRHFSNWAALENSRAEAFVKFCRQKQPDFMFIVFHPADYFGHRGTRNAAYVERSYELCDQLVAKCLEAADEDTVVMVVSDHGMNEVRDVFFVNKWLEDEGFLKFKEEPDQLQIASLFADLLDFDTDLFSEKQRKFALDRWLGVYGGLSELRKQALGAAFSDAYRGLKFGHGNIDWNATEVFYGGFYGQFFINRAPGSDYDAVADRFMARAEALKNPRTGQPIFSQVRKGQDVYGSFAPGITPDLIGESADFAVMFNGLYQHYLKVEHTIVPREDCDPRFQRPQFGYLGDHTPYGVFIASGPGVRSNCSLNMVDIIDIAPTILALLGVPVPAAMDGRVLAEMSSSGIAEMSNESVIRNTEARLIEAEAESIRQTLRKLGYKL